MHYMNALCMNLGRVPSAEENNIKNIVKVVAVVIFLGVAISFVVVV